MVKKMDSFDLLTISLDDVFVLLKLFYLLGLLMYLLFAFVVIRQVEMMLAALGGVIQLPLRLMAWMHLVMVLVVIVFALVV